MSFYSLKAKPKFLAILFSAAILCVLVFFLPSSYGGYAPAETCVQSPPGVIAWWPMDEEAGATVADAAGSNSGTHIGGLTHEAGKSGRALRFDGTRSFVGVRDSDLWAFGASNFTIELWANFATPGGGSIGQPSHMFIANDESPGTANKWFFALGGGFLNFHINGPGIGEQFFPLVPFSPEVGRWYHLAVRRQGNVYTIFIDGEPAGSAENTIAIPNANALLTIGEAEGLFFMKGLLDEVAIYNRALADGELRAIFLAGSVGKCKPPIITTRVLTSAQLGKSYEQALRAEFGTPPYIWSVASGSLPSGIALSASGVLTGTPQETGSFNFAASLVDAKGEPAMASLALDVLLIPPPPEIRINKVGNIPVPGRTIDYFIVVENIGVGVAKDIEISELLDPLEQFTDPSSTNPSVNVIKGNILVWNIEKLNPGEFKILTYSVTISPSVALGDLVKGQAFEVCDQCRTTDACRNINLACSFFTPDNIPSGGRLIDIFQKWFNDHFPSKECAAFTLQCAEECKKRCPHASYDQNSQGPTDPNEKLVVAKRFVRPEQTLVYPIHFENVGTVEARDVFVTDMLDPNLDLSTLNLLTAMGGSFDVATRTLKWELLNINLQPGKTGNVLLSARPLRGLPSGTVIRNKATIQFEIFQPFVTNEVVNIIDSTRPASVVAPLPPVTSTPDFQISWSGSDAIGEIDHYTILVSVNGGAFTPFLERTRETSAIFRGESGKTYGFLSIATDTAGNIEVQSAVAEATTQVVAGVDLAITKVAAPNPILTGSNLTYTINVTNNGPGAATNVTVTDNLLASTTFASCSSTGGGVCGGSGNNRTVTFTSLASGASATITLVVNVNCSLANGSAISNTTTVNSSTPDPDTNNNSATANVTASNPPQVITNPSASPSALWPPNHEMVNVTVNYDVTDNCGALVCALSVSSNEPINDTGDGDTAPDWEIVGAHHVRLRAERAGNGVGRIYTIIVTCRDNAGNSSNRSVTVRAPHSLGQN